MPAYANATDLDLKANQNLDRKSNQCNDLSKTPAYDEVKENNWVLSHFPESIELFFLISKFMSEMVTQLVIIVMALRYPTLQGYMAQLCALLISETSSSLH